MSITKGHTFSDGDTLTATKLNNLVDNAGDGAATFNDAGAAVDFRIEGDTDTHLFFVDGSADRISIGVSADAPAAVLEITGDSATAVPVLQVNNLEDTINGVEVVSDSLTTGSALSVKSNSSDTGTRSIAHVHQDHASASGASALKITQDNAAAATIDLTAQASIVQLKDNTTDALSFDSTGTVGILQINTNDDSQYLTTNACVSIDSSGVSNTGTKQIPLQVSSDGASTQMQIRNTSTSGSGDGYPIFDMRGSRTAWDADARWFRMELQGNYDRFVMNMVDSTGTIADAGIRITRRGATGVLEGESGGTGQMSVYPALDGDINLGTPAKRWDTVYGMGGVSSSDANFKQDVEELTESEKKVALKLKGLIRKFRWKKAVAKKGDAARIHVGIIAQDVKAAFESEGLDAHRYGIFCQDDWFEETDEYGNTEGYVEDAEGREFKTLYSVRYDQLLAFIISAL